MIIASIGGISRLHSVERERGRPTMSCDIARESSSTARACFKTPEGRYNLAKATPGAESARASTTTRCENENLARVRRRMTRATLSGVEYVVVNVKEGVGVMSIDANGANEVVKKIAFDGADVTALAWRARSVRDGYDLLVGMANGEVHGVDLASSLLEKGKRGTTLGKWNAKGGTTSARVTAVAWRERGESSASASRGRNEEGDREFAFDWVATYADGSLFTYDSRRVGAEEGTFAPVVDRSALSVVQASKANANPVERWHFGRSPLTAVAFSPDCDLLAVVNGDGMCRILDVDGSRPNVVAGFKSYYAGFNAVKWSACGRYVIAGGESDLIEVWGLYEREVIAWGCGGHRSWICEIGVDASRSAGGVGRALRFVSVGEDCRVALWDVIIPGDDDDVPNAERDEVHWSEREERALSASSHRRASSFSGPDAKVCQAARRDEVPRVVPVMTHKLHDHPVSAVAFTQDGILTASSCDVKLWLRPENSRRYVKNNHELSEFSD